ncbi:Nucleolar protein 16 [Saguinus oedipus]|uniref:Nucleolar protein 16 n=1 Tax=Saguinus oedipus TaxID=9490 RepID=A0ABQ9WA09_SAGOE|nr:Nucleolar protein 16 [Saguinus oedipus]
MGLAVDPNKAVPLRKRKNLVLPIPSLRRFPSFRPPHSQNAQLTVIKGLLTTLVKVMEVDIEERPKELVRKPYVLNDLEAEASLPEKKGNTLSRDLIDYVRYMVENHGEDYKAMARDEKNYYQDTPKQIRNKINVYKRFYPAEWQDFLDSLQKNKMEVDLHVVETKADEHHGTVTEGQATSPTRGAQLLTTNPQALGRLHSVPVLESGDTLDLQCPQCAAGT